MSRRPNVLLILTDQLRYPPEYESEELAAYRRRALAGVERLRRSGVSFRHHYPMACACAPSRASLLTGQYPSLHGVTQTDGLLKQATDPEVSWLDPAGIPTLGDWFRAAGYRTYYKGKWHVSHAQLEGEDGEALLSIDDRGQRLEGNIKRYLDADLLDEYGFSEWVGPEPHGVGKHNMGMLKDPFTAEETVELLGRLGSEQDAAPWLTVCSFLNPHDDAYYGIVGLPQGLRYRPWRVPRVPQAPTRDEDLSTKPRCQQSYADAWPRLGAPQPWSQTHLRFYYELQAAVGAQITRVLDALAASGALEDTIVVFSSDHGDMQGAHGGMHEKWHVAYEEALRVPFIVSGAPLGSAEEREIDFPTSHADLLPTLLGLAEIDREQALAELRESHGEALPPVGRDLSEAIHSAGAARPPSPVLFVTDDEISEGGNAGPSPFHKLAKLTRRFSEIVQPNHLETVVAEVPVGGEPHLVKLTRYHDNQQFWTAPGEFDERIERGRTRRVTEPEPDEYELYDLTRDPFERRNLAHPSQATRESRELLETMVGLLIEQLERKRLTPAAGEAPGYRPPAALAAGSADS